MSSKELYLDGGEGGFIDDDLSNKSSPGVVIPEPNEAPIRPEIIAASFKDEVAKRDLTGNQTEYAHVPEERTTSVSFEGHGDEEEQWEEAEDEEAPPPPETIAASYEAIGNSDRDMKKTLPDTIENNNDRQVRAGRMELMHEVFHNGGTPTNMKITEGRLDPSPSTPAIEQAGAISILYSTLQSNHGQCLLRSGQADVEIALPPTSEPMPPPQPILDRNNQSLPLLEAKCVDDVVYEAFSLSDTQDQNAQGGAKRPQKYRVVVLGLILMQRLRSLHL